MCYLVSLAQISFKYINIVFACGFLITINYRVEFMNNLVNNYKQKLFDSTL